MRTMSLQSRLLAYLALAAASVAALAAALSLAFAGQEATAIIAAVVLSCGALGAAFYVMVRVSCLGSFRMAADLARAMLRGDGKAGSGPDAGPSDFAGLVAALGDISTTLTHDRGLLGGILAGLPMPYLLVDASERTVRVNAACLEMLEIDGPVERCLGKTLAEVFYNDPSRKTAVGQSIRDGKVFRNLEVAIKGHKGGERHVLANVFPLYDLEKTCIGGLCLYVDMTALKQAEIVNRENYARMTETADRLKSVVDVVTSASGHLSAQIRDSSRGAEEQADRVRETATAMQEMTSTVREVARNASRAAETADSARRKADDGAQAVTQVVRGIGEVQSVALELKSDMAALGGQAEGIGRILNVISDIADQTNLLALNAAIEAARAGDAGRGFAVVADEVRKLAEKTMVATREVGEAISGIQEGARKNVANVEAAGRRIDEATRLAGNSGEALTEIVSLVDLTTDQVRAIAAASEEQSAASEEIGRSIDDVSRISSGMHESMGRCAQAIDDLANQSRELTGLIGLMQGRDGETGVKALGSARPAR